MTNDKKVYQDENGQAEFDFSTAKEVFEPHKFAKIYGEYLSDVDFVLEDMKRLICLEYKNASVPNASDPGAFSRKIGEDRFWDKIAKKYYGTLFLIWACGKNTLDLPIQYVLLMEMSPGIDNALKKRLMMKMQNKLPYKFNNMNEIKRSIISEFQIMNMEEWRLSYPQYPINDTNS